MSEITEGLSIGPASPVAAPRKAAPVPRARVPGKSVPSAQAAPPRHGAIAKAAIVRMSAVDRMAEF